MIILENFLVCLTGLPASGKSIFAYKLKSILENKFHNYSVSIIDPDVIRKEITPDKFDYKVEQEVRRNNLKLVKKTLKEGQIVISDDLNYYTSMRHDLKNIANNMNISYFIIHISTPMKICLKWNEERGSPIPNKIIIDINEKFDDFGKYNWDTPFDEFDFSKMEDFNQRTKNLLNKIINKIKFDKLRKKGEDQLIQGSLDNEKLDKITRNIVGELMMDPKYHPYRNQIIKCRKNYLKIKINTTINEKEISKSFKEYLENYLNTKIS